MRVRQVPLAVALILGVSLAAAQSTNRVVGSITAISGHTLTIQPDNGAPSSVTVSDTARILRSQPGAKKLSEATPIPLGDLAIGDRVLALMNGGTATAIIAMKQADIVQKHETDAADWQRGAAGLVKTVDAASGTVTITSGTRTITIHTTPTTSIRRYSPDSAQFSRSTHSTLDKIHAGDQLRVRGSHNADESEITADAIITGSFRNIIGSVLSTNAAENSLTVNDRTSKEPVVIHITAESQLHKLPSAMARQLAVRFQRHSDGTGGERQKATLQRSSSSENGSVRQHNGDLSRMLESTPTVALSGLHKGDAVLLVATEGTPGAATAITLLAGVEPLLSASTAGDQSLFAASWNLNGGASGGSGAGAGGAGGGDGAP